MQRASHTKNALVLVLALALIASLGGGLAVPRAAFGATDAIDDEPDALQQQIEQSAAAYDEASKQVADLEQQMADNQARIAELEQQLPQQQGKSGDAMRTLYQLQQNGSSLFNLILGAESLSDFLNTIEYMERVHQRNVNELTRLSQMKDELETTKASLEKAKRTADNEKSRAADALAEAQAARERAQQAALERAQAEAEAAQRAKEAAEAAAAAQKQEEEAASQKEAAEQPGAGAGGGAVEAPSPDEADWTTDKATFVDAWAGRIDAYLAGSPLGGQGRTFAEAAWDYGVDPRWSPAISTTESSKGAACAYFHNAWGWGNISWDSWEEAINAHVRGLARGYGYTISVAAAQKYCPPNWEHWYNTTLAQMNMI